MAKDIEKTAVEKAYDRWAPIYDLVFGPVFERGRRAAILAADRVGGRILEVGVGTGISLPDYSRNSRLYGVDISGAMLGKARERVIELGLNNVEGLEVMDAEHLKFSDASFDVVVAQYVITAVPNPEAALDEFARVLRPGGEIVILSRSRRGSGIAPSHRALVRADGPQARVAHRVCVGALRALGGADRWHRLDGAPRHAPARAFLAHSLWQARHCRIIRSAASNVSNRLTTPPFNPLITAHGGLSSMANFREALRVQRWDDHRYYHHSRINQSLHLVSAISFLCAYAMAFSDPAVAALIGWLVAMTTRQIGHLFFEPKGYDHINHATHEHKEEIKVGYNLQRKIVLLTIWALSPLTLYIDPTLMGIFEPHKTAGEFVHHVALVWLFLGVVGLLFRTVHLFFIRDVQTGLVWMTKILTDPFHDIKLYYKAPFYLLRGELIDPRHAQHDEDELEEQPRTA